jgi:gas vesicle protein
MATAPAKTADDLADSIKQLVDRVVDAKFTHEMTKRGQELAGVIAEAVQERGTEVTEAAAEAWKDSRPMRRDAAKRMARATNDAAKWSDQTWRRSLRPLVRDLWKRRTVAIGAAGAAVPAGRELVDTAAVRLGLKQREERHWSAFFLGLLIGAAAGAIAALLTTPKRGSEMRQELATRADEIATKAKDDWVPMFQREEGVGNGHVTESGGAIGGDASGSVQEGATQGVEAASATAGDAAMDTADAINESFDVDREPTA